MLLTVVTVTRRSNEFEPDLPEVLSARVKVLLITIPAPFRDQGQERGCTPAFVVLFSFVALCWSVKSSSFWLIKLVFDCST